MAVAVRNWLKMICLMRLIVGDWRRLGCVCHWEPLPVKHPFWAHPAIAVWPHVAAQTNPNSAAQQVAAAITAIMVGLEPKTALIGSVAIRVS